MAGREERIGVFVCHCGLNIAGTVDVKRVVAEIKKYPGVVHAEDYMYMCSDPGQELMRKAIIENRLTGVVNANCSPSLHEKTFRRVCAIAGLNPYRCEIANIREQCSWPHAHDKESATRKAIAIVKATVERLRLNMMLTPLAIPLTKRALVVGGGIAGIQAALDIANGGYEVVLVEKSDSLGGRVMQLSATFPTLEHPSDFMQSNIKEVLTHPRIRLYPGAEVEEVNGYVGSFTVAVKQNGRLTEEDIGAVVVATGYEMFPREKLPVYPDDPDIVSGLQFEQILAGRDIRRPSDGTIPGDVVFIQCAGSRDPEHGVPYCSRVCCMYTAKQVLLYRKAVPDSQAYVCYMDLRSDAKGFEEFIQQVMSHDGVLYIRGNVSRVFRDGDKLKVWTVDTLSGKNLEISADMVVLALAIVPRQSTRELARKLNISLDEHGFLTEAHIKLRPVESLTAGIYLAGTAQWPRDIPDTIASASAAASKVLSLFSRKELLHEPTIAHVDEDVCSGCGVCVGVCAYKAITLDGRRRVAVVNEALCEGCGACAATCPSKAMQHTNWSHRQLFSMIDVAGGG
ncbi:MAG: CoB--CoM heterodisulfide reductase iron-sulfur subunit A family protein [Dehalococcoidia bacterium]|nr:CoB--CoM heterodisulfide reductase iron-sulfur subunit A family protein [Dehalococcoidia bacterium]